MPRGAQGNPTYFGRRAWTTVVARGHELERVAAIHLPGRGSFIAMRARPRAFV